MMEKLILLHNNFVVIIVQNSDFIILIFNRIFGILYQFYTINAFVRVLYFNILFIPVIFVLDFILNLN